MGAVEALAEGIQRAGADVAVNDAESAEGEDGKLPSSRSVGAGMCHWGLAAHMIMPPLWAIKAGASDDTAESATPAIRPTAKVTFNSFMTGASGTAVALSQF